MLVPKLGERQEGRITYNPIHLDYDSCGFIL